ncbi:hypothetical protein CA600_05040 [Paenibacillus sp. VTT E-133280]|uniref:hypothetical protein n=1 Tax=unclassified Paenibacillus TaxID=185978 RepID=UPI000BA0895E|nr:MULTISPECIES: hypothetical protein [unclassified Paenibacillus]MDH6370690.1 hypothetical protein [Paenibacillus sp. PastF-3]OZQ68791.1 hypothetical protein CA600_05040 [Paenibacillus sp. VTT E-133280]
MNQQMLFKKLALSALLVSAVAAPTAVNAASEAKDQSAKSTKAAVVTPATSGALSVTLTKMDWVDPLELAKTYAPNTLEDWKKTLDEYYKNAGFSVTGATGLVPAQPVEGVQFTKEILSDDALPVSYIEAGHSAQLVLPDDMERDTEFTTTSIKAVAATSIAISMADLSEADKAFFKAQEDLNSAAKSKDATVIKEALANLLDHYKEKIKDLETAK